MHYRSIADLNAAIVRGFHKLPHDIDLVVGVPRSGLLAANLLSLSANIPMSDLDSFVVGKVFSVGSTKAPHVARARADRRKVLILDDSINTGAAMRDVRAKLAASSVAADLVFAAIYGLRGDHPEVDHIFEVVPQPRVFQWNVMHHSILCHSCVDIDGLLCADPVTEENDDGEAYRKFLESAPVMHRPSRKIGYLVTSRLEKYRALTEGWLSRHRIEYGKLVMLNVASANERRRQSAHGRFKAEFYRGSNAVLFIESEQDQAATIARIAGKPVLCTATQQMVMPGSPARRLGEQSNSVRPAPMHPADTDSKSSIAFANRDNGNDAIDVRYVLVKPNHQQLPRTLISYLGPSAEGAAQMIRSVIQICASKSELPVIVLSDLNQELMTSCPAPVEFLPEMRHLPFLRAEAYQRYIDRRWGLILAKWQVNREVALAASFDDFLATQAATSPGHG